MKTQYKDWIEKNVEGDGHGKCAEVTLAMQSAFPELVRIRGHYHCISWGKREHWWLVDSSGEVVDPTANQFPTKGAGGYVEHDESQPEPTGMCPNCGGYCYNGSSVCDDYCERQYAAYLNSI